MLCIYIMNYPESLNEIKLEYVETRMSFIAPNLSQIVGSTVAAKLMGNVVMSNGKLLGDFIVIPGITKVIKNTSL